MSLKIKKEKLDLHIKGIESDDRVFKLVSSSAEKKIPILIDLESSVTALNMSKFLKHQESLYPLTNGYVSTELYSNELSNEIKKKSVDLINLSHTPLFLPRSVRNNMKNIINHQESKQDSKQFSINITASNNLSSFVEPLQMIETSKEDESKPTKIFNSNDSFENVEAKKDNCLLINKVSPNEPPLDISKPSLLDQIISELIPEVHNSSIPLPLKLVPLEIISLETQNTVLKTFLDKYPTDLIEQPNFNRLSRKDRKIRWDAFCYSVWPVYLKIFSEPESEVRKVNNKITLFPNILPDKTLEKKRFWNSPDVRFFMENNIDKFMSKEYRIVALEDKETYSGVKFYFHLVNRESIEDKIDQETKEDEIKEGKWIVEKFIGFRFNEARNEFRYQVKFADEYKTYSYASRDLDNAEMKESYRAECMQKRCMKKYEKIPRANVKHLKY